MTFMEVVEMVADMPLVEIDAAVGDQVTLHQTDPQLETRLGQLLVYVTCC